MYDDYVLTNVLLALSYELRMHTQQSKPRNNQPSEQPATHKLCGIETQQSTTGIDTQQSITGIDTQQSTTGIDTQQPTGQTKPTQHRQQTTINHPLILRRSHIFSIAVANVSTLQSTSNVSPLTMFLSQILCSSGHMEMSAGCTREDSSLRRLAAAANDCRIGPDYGEKGQQFFDGRPMDGFHPSI